MTQTTSNKDDPILILGAGAWGLSTALHLTRQGYGNITVLERSSTIPSPHSAAWDLNKIVRAEYEDPFYTDMALQAIDRWKNDPAFAPYYHQTGYIVAATGKAPPKAVEHLEKALESVSEHPAFESKITPLQGRDQFREVAWQLTGPMTGFKGYINELAGYAHSADALHGVWLHCAASGVRFVTGESAGRVTRLLYQDQRCIGAQTADDKIYRAHTTICALGAHVASLIPSIGGTVVARSWSVAHIQLTKTECDLLRGLPVLNVRDLGFFFEPDPETRLFKLCPLGAGFVNSSSPSSSSSSPTSIPSAKISLPPTPDQTSVLQNFIPAEDESKLRRLLHETLPWLSDRPFVDKKLCWFADTADSDYVVDFVPDTKQSLVVLSGDSGHGFKMMPVLGREVVLLIEAGRQEERRWRFKTPDPEKGDKGEWGGKVSWRIGETKEVKELIAEAQRGLNRARL